MAGATTSPMPGLRTSQQNLVHARLHRAVETSQTPHALLAAAVLAANNCLGWRFDIRTACARRRATKEQNLVRTSHGIVVGTQSGTTRIPIAAVAPNHRPRECLDVGRGGRSAARDALLGRRPLARVHVGRGAPPAHHVVVADDVRDPLGRPQARVDLHQCPICASVKSSPAETTSADTILWFSAKLPTARAAASKCTD